MDDLRAELDPYIRYYGQIATLARAMGVPEHVVRRARSSGVSAQNRALIRDGLQRLPALPDTYAARAAAVEQAPTAYALGVLEGQAQAVRQFLESALQEQENLISGIRRLGSPALPPPVSREKLDETGRRQLADDAKAGLARRKATG